MTDTERIELARRVAHTLYEGTAVVHRSCGVALAETFGRDVRPYLLLRRGGLTGERVCGAMAAGEMVLAELLGSPDPAAPLDDRLRGAVTEFRRLCDERLDRGPERLITCNDLLGRLDVPFDSPERRDYCTGLAAEVAAIVAEVAVAAGCELPAMRVPER